MPSSRIPTLLAAHDTAERAMHSARSQVLVDHARAERDAHRHSLMLAGWPAGRDDVSGARPELPCAESYLLARVEFEANTGCWLWARGWTTDGYGACKVQGYSRRAHRMSWEIYKGPIPAGLHALHRCDTPACVNPHHLRLGTHADNMAEMSDRRRHRQGDRSRVQPRQKTHCNNGHPFDAENTYVTPRGHRFCRACGRAAKNAWYARNRA